jgi:hypothetical protein
MLGNGLLGIRAELDSFPKPVIAFTAALLAESPDPDND